jgi:hypothetical protein
MSPQNHYKKEKIYIAVARGAGPGAKLQLRLSHRSLLRGGKKIRNLYS